MLGAPSSIVSKKGIQYTLKRLEVFYDYYSTTQNNYECCVTFFYCSNYDTDFAQQVLFAVDFGNGKYGNDQGSVALSL